MAGSTHPWLVCGQVRPVSSDLTGIGEKPDKNEFVLGKKAKDANDHIGFKQPNVGFSGCQ
jgi:hypothetical protein